PPAPSGALPGVLPERCARRLLKTLRRHSKPFWVRNRAAKRAKRPDSATRRAAAPVGQRIAAPLMIGLLRVMLPVEPRKGASPKAKIPPSEAMSQYPCPDGVEAMLTI